MLRAVGSVFAAHVAELGGKHDLIAPVFDGLADQLFVVADAVHIGRIQER